MRHSQGDSNVTGGDSAAAALQRNATAIVNVMAHAIPLSKAGESKAVEFAKLLKYLGSHFRHHLVRPLSAC